MTTSTLTLSHTLDLTPKKKARRGKYNQEALDALLAKAGNLPEEMTPAMEEAVKKYEEKQRESLEKKEKSLEFEEHNFKIDSTGWKEEKRKVVGGKKQIKVKVNSTGDVIEYLEGPTKGEQLFIGYDAFIRELCKAKNCNQEEAESKYLMTVEEFEKNMKDKPDNSEEYKRFFNKEIKGRLAGYESDKEFYTVNKCLKVWLAGGYYTGFNQYRWGRHHSDKNYGLSGRLLKN